MRFNAQTYADENGENSLPARLTSQRAAKVLGFQEHDVPVLVAAKLLAPLGKPRQNATKYFASCEILRLAVNRQWLAKATQVVYDCWKEKNARRKGDEGDRRGVSLVE